MRELWNLHSESLQAQIEDMMNQLWLKSNPAQAAYSRLEVEWAERKLAKAQYAEGCAERRDHWWDMQAENSSRV